MNRRKPGRSEQARHILHWRCPTPEPIADVEELKSLQRKERHNLFRAEGGYLLRIDRAAYPRGGRQCGLYGMAAAADPLAHLCAGIVARGLLRRSRPLVRGFGAWRRGSLCPPLRRNQPATSSDFGHSASIGRDAFAAFASGGASLIWRKFVGGTLFVGRLSPFTRDLSLLLGIHGSKTAIVRTGCHVPPFLVPLGRGSPLVLTSRNHTACLSPWTPFGWLQVSLPSRLQRPCQ